MSHPKKRVNINGSDVALFIDDDVIGYFSVNPFFSFLGKQASWTRSNGSESLLFVYNDET